MYAVGRLSSYITRGVSTVSGPFHPFGGAIDIVVVQQQDGSLKSSPWYVRFGKFQGVLKAKERVVDINVNGVKADFHMCLNPRGEAYFLREEVGSKDNNAVGMKSLDNNFDHCNSLTDVSNSQAFSRNLGFVLERKSRKEDNSSNEDDNTNVGRLSAEIAADLLEMKWSTSFSTKRSDKNQDDGEITSGKLEASLVLHEEHFVNKSEDDVVKAVDDVIVANVDGDGIVQVYEAHGGSLGNGVSNEEIESSMESNGQLLTKEEQFVFSDLVDRSPSVDRKSTSQSLGSDPSPHGYDHGLRGNIRRFASDSDIAYKSCEFIEEEIRAQAKSLPNLWSRFDEFDLNKRRLSKWNLLRLDLSRILIEGDKQFPDNKSKDCKGRSAGGDATNINNGKSWSLWPFTSSRSKRLSKKDEYCKKDCDFDNVSEVDGEKDQISKSNKTRKELAPTSEQLESLNLSEGKNTVTFTFSTAVLGNQQVDARIFLWRWDTRIVISDVDGTITKSDVLGQFMPLVGKDWSHLGVTHLFSAIKENGYQILFLSARSISQADITRQFLINLKQEGKVLPEGPVVISPDGLFPSLFREVIRRAPHEFKIACLEDIRACFPADWNPFYAGFGNRDTDEFSYLKVGIPKVKIFIINPKGEVVVNRCNDTKSYSSLHTIVNGIFPPVSVDEEVETLKEEL